MWCISMRYERGRFGSCLLEPVVRHLAHQPDRGREHMVVAGMELGRRQGRAGLSSSPRNSTTSRITWAKTKRSPRETTGTERAPRRRSSSRPPSSAITLIDWNSIPRTERYSFTLRQLVQCGCQKTLIGSPISALSSIVAAMLRRYFRLCNSVARARAYSRREFPITERRER